MSGPLDPSTIQDGVTVQLTYNPSGTFGDAERRSDLAGQHELLHLGQRAAVDPRGAAGDGLLQGRSHRRQQLGAALPGRTRWNSSGNERSAAVRPELCLHVPGGRRRGVVDSGCHVPTTRRQTAHDLGDITSSGIVRVPGAIGDDPFYTLDQGSSPGNDVDMYHFHVSGPGSYAFIAEVFAGRIGSPLDPGVSLFRLDPTDQSLHFIDGNNNTYNPVQTSDHYFTPLYSDSVLYESLTAGDYYVAVAAGSNTPSPLENQPEGSLGLFDPNVSHSGQNGWSTGPYVLNLLVHAVPDPPHVLSTSPSDGVDSYSAPDATDRHVRRAGEHTTRWPSRRSRRRLRPPSPLSISRGPTAPSTSLASTRTIARPIKPRSPCSTGWPTALIRSIFQDPTGSMTWPAIRWWAMTRAATTWFLFRLMRLSAALGGTPCNGTTRSPTTTPRIPRTWVSFFRTIS